MFNKMSYARFRDLITFPRFKMNLKADHMWIYSYGLKVAQIDHINKEITPLGHWSATTSKHISYVAGEYEYKLNKEIKQ